MLDKSGDPDEERSTSADDTEAAGKGVVPDVALRLRQAVEGAGGNAHVARKAGMALKNLTNYLAGVAMKPGALVALADACQVSVEWLAAGRGNMVVGARGASSHIVVQSPADAPVGYVTIPHLNVEASAGKGSLIGEEQIVDYFAFSENFMRHVLGFPASDVTVIEVRGDSMQPTLYDGDAVVVLIRPDQQLEDGQLYVMETDGSLLVKRIQLSARGGVTLVSDNPRYAPERMTRDELIDLRIIGRVLWRGGPPRS